MAINLENQGLRSIISEYDLLFIDIWGVIHNGIELYKESIEVLNKLENEKKEYVLLTNAPRPNSTVIKYLKKMGLENEKCKKVYTSGEAALSYLGKNLNKSKFYHIGPPRDFDLFKLFEKNKVKDINESEFILCTGLFEDQETELEYYKNLLKRKDKIKMVCTNPDLIVDRGENREYCAGSVAKIFEEIGGQVEYFGKPYPLVYEQSIKLKNKKILCIGDNLNTDIKGANLQNFSSLLISGGIHRNEINNNLKDIFSKYNVNVDFIQSKLKW